MDNLQTEVLELEFNHFSKGFPTISEEDFARILLRYTTLTPQDYQDYLDRLRQRVPTVKVWSSSITLLASYQELHNKYIKLK